MSKHFASQTAIDRVSLEIQPGEFFSLLGPSGCGKTTLLRSIAGFESPSEGDIIWSNQSILALTPQERPFNMVFQKYALFPHLSVFENVAFGLKLKNFKGTELQKKVSEALELVGLGDFGSRLPETLSGGQAQRVALARAIVNEPQVLLLDEPLSALDQKMREKMQTELRAIQRRLGITFILVTHDQEEALSLSDRIAVFNRGRLEQVATPKELYENPKTHFVAQFIGSRGKLIGADSDTFVRPDRILIGKNASAKEVSGKVTGKAFKGLHWEIVVSVDGSSKGELRVFTSSEKSLHGIEIGQPIDLHFAAEDALTFARPQAGSTS